MRAVLMVMLAALVVLAGYSIVRQRSESVGPGLYAGTTAPPVKPTPSPWPSYVAENYQGSKHPPLTRNQVQAIRTMLSRIKRCQRKFLRYAFRSPQNAQPLIMFFGPVPAGRWVHALGTGNLYYDPVEGRTIAEPDDSGHYDYSIQYDVDVLGCPRGNAAERA